MVVRDSDIEYVLMNNHHSIESCEMYGTKIQMEKIVTKEKKEIFDKNDLVYAYRISRFDGIINALKEKKKILYT